METQNGANAPVGSACLQTAHALFLELEPYGASLVLLTCLEVLLWMA